MSGWRPTASTQNLRRRAELIAEVRAFFSGRGVLEVETPLLASTTASDPHIASLSCSIGGSPRYLQTSPEFAMKRLLAAGSGAIYQLCKAFRDGERGRRHNPEFTILEWYRPGFDHFQLMDEIDELLAVTLSLEAADRLTYADAFVRWAGIDPHLADVGELRATARRLGIAQNLELDDADGWLDLLLAVHIQPHLGRGRPTFLYDYPASQAALARVRQGVPPVAERFEVFVEGVELANGYHELNDAAEQRRRLVADNDRRRDLGLPQVPIDTRLLAALEHGIGDCAGVALGFDRLVMLATGATNIAEVIAFPLETA